MPEGDTVFQAARTLDHALADQVITRSDLRMPALANADLASQTILDCKPRGKHMLLHTDGGWTLHTHFMMDGAWYLYAPGARWNGGAAHEIRIVLETRAWIAVGYRMGIVDLFPTIEEPRRLGHLGPDILGPDWDLAEAVRRIRARPERTIGEALLDQTCLAGIGNIYKNESLFLQRVHPLRRVADLENLEALLQRAQKLMQYSVTTGRQCTTGMPREPFYVFERGGKACRACRTRIEVQRGAPQGAPRVTDTDLDRAMRTTWWCPRCQPAPA